MKSNSFFEQVYQLVASIPTGKVATYGQIATLLGHPRAAKMVGWALHQLPEHRALPWHRVINRNGGISFDLKNPVQPLQKHLLEAEGVIFDEYDRVNLKKYQHIFE
ncbi:MGMT family protein [candidate division KSB1 bacterium]|nr:MGMT family protein [candidate division KSB1 bacterium]